MPQILEQELQIHPKLGSVTKIFSGDKLSLSFKKNIKSEALLDDKKISLKDGEANIIFREPGRYKLIFKYMDKGHRHKTMASYIQVIPKWTQNAVVYNAFIRFFGAKSIREDGRIMPGEGGSFDDVKHHLKKLKDMGINVLYLNPIHMIGELYRNYNPHDLLPEYLQPGCPYSIKDYKSIDPELAYNKDNPRKVELSDPMKEFKELVTQAHKLKIKVVMDMVFNHTSHDFVLQRIHPEWFLYKENITSLDDPYIYPEEINEKPWGNAKNTMSPFDHGYWWKDTAQLNWEYKIPDASNKAPKNPGIKQMWSYFKSITKYWTRFGIDGFRCDVAYRIPPEFWEECIQETKELAKDMGKEIIFIAESYCDDLQTLQEADFDFVYGDYSNKLYTVAQVKGYMDYITSKDYFPEGSQWFIFPECHDFHRSAKKISQFSQDELADLRANQSRWVITACLPGLPMIFNGFEKMEWQPVNLFSYSKIDWEKDKDLTRYIKKINLIRKNHKALQEGEYIPIPTNQGWTDQAQLFAFLRKTNDETILVCTNMDVNNSAKFVMLDLPKEFKKYELRDLLNHTKYKREGNKLIICLEPGQSHIFLVVPVK